MKNLFTFFAAVFIIMFSTKTAWGTVITSAQTGSWNATTTWVGGVVPGSADDAIIANTHVVTLDISPTVTNCTVNTGGTLDASTFTLTVTGTFTLTGTAKFKQAGTVGAVPGGARSFDNASTYIFNGAQTNITGYFTFGNLTWSSSANGAPNSSLTINGDLTLLNCLEFRGTAAGAKTNTVGGNVVIDNSVLVGPSGASAGSCTWNISGNVTTQNLGILRGVGSLAPLSASSVYNIGGNLTNNGSIENGNGSGPFTITFNGSGSQSVTGNSLGTVPNITINNSTGVVLGVGTDPTVTGTLTLTTGTLTNSSATLTLGNGSTISRSGGSLSTAPATTSVNVTYTGSSSITTGPELPTSSTALSDLTINNSAGVILNAAATCNGTFTLTSGKLTTTSTNLLKLSSGATLSGGSSSSFVNGPMAQTIASTSSTAKTFPIGKGTAYRPITLTVTQDAATATAYTAEVFNSAPTSRTLAGTTDKVSSVRYWNVTKGTGASVTAGTILINYDTDDGVSDYLKLTVVEANGTSWTDLVGNATANTTGSITTTVAILSTLGDFTLANMLTGTNPLPVELTSFTATARNGKVELAWATATEVNNYGFEVERKTINNDQSTMINWEKLGFVEGHGTTNAPQSYSFTDAAARVGKFSYRLKQIDRDGKFEYHQAVDVTLGISANTVWLDNNYPNPFNPSTKISFVLGTTGVASLKVYDLLGKEVITLADGVFNSGELQSFTFDASKYPSGIYYYQLKSGTRTEMKKMLLLK